MYIYPRRILYTCANTHAPVQPAPEKYREGKKCEAPPFFFLFLFFFFASLKD